MTPAQGDGQGGRSGSSSWMDTTPMCRWSSWRLAGGEHCVCGPSSPSERHLPATRRWLLQPAQTCLPQAGRRLSAWLHGQSSNQTNVLPMAPANMARISVLPPCSLSLGPRWPLSPLPSNNVRSTHYSRTSVAADPSRNPSQLADPISNQQKGAPWRDQPGTGL